MGAPAVTACFCFYREQGSALPTLVNTRPYDSRTADNAYRKRAADKTEQGWKTQKALNINYHD